MTNRRYGLLEVDRAGHTAVITLNRPEKLNALNHQLASELHEALDELSGDDSTRTVILTGAGRGFCSGADVAEFRESGQTQSFSSQGPGIESLGLHIRQIGQPVIAAINGVAAGAGLAIALACDIRIASQDASVSCIFVKRSLVPDTGVSLLLPRLVGHGVAMEMALTGNIYDAQWALDKGLVNKVVPPSRLMEESLALAGQIASNPPLCVHSTKQILYQQDEELLDATRKEAAANAALAGTEDRIEAVRSFLEKRPPVYRGR